MYKLIGYERKQGSFTHKDSGEIVEYDNYELFYVTDEKRSDNMKGLFCDSARAKVADLKFSGCKNIDEALNKEVYFIVDLTAKADENGRARLNVDRIVVL